MKITKHLNIHGEPEYVLVAEYTVGIMFDDWSQVDNTGSINLFLGVNLMATICGEHAVKDFKAQMEALA